MSELLWVLFLALEDWLAGCKENEHHPHLKVVRYPRKCMKILGVLEGLGMVCMYAVTWQLDT